MARRPLPSLAAGLVALWLGGCADPTAVLDVATTPAEDRSIGEVASDTAIKLEFDRRLLSGKNRDLFFDVNCDVYEGRLMLTGAVRSGHAKARAVAIARNVRGVTLVYDDIQVTEEGGIGRTALDALIEAKLKARLIGAKGVKSINYRWQSINGTVYVIGRARSRRELDAVMAVIKDTQDVKRVVQHVDVVSGSR